MRIAPPQLAHSSASLPARFEKMDDPLAGVMGEGVEMGVAIVAIEERMRRKADHK